MDAAINQAAFVRKEFNRNRKILIKNIPGIAVEVRKGGIYQVLVRR